MYHIVRETAMPEKPPYEKLRVWQLANRLALEVYRVTAAFPTSERYGLTSQLRRAAVGVLANLAEGNARAHRREYIHFCQIARASGVEVRCLLGLSRQLTFLRDDEHNALAEGYSHLGALIHALILRLKEQGTKDVA